LPRKAPKEVIEHRITFGDFERKELRDAINAYQGDKIAENIPNYILGGAGLIAGGAAALAAYALWRWLDLGAITDFIEDGWNTVKGVTLDFASDIGIGPNFKERVMLDLSQMKTEAEIIAYITPLIAKVDKDIARLQEYDATLSTFPMGGGLKHSENMIENRRQLKAWLESQKMFWLRSVATKDPNSTYRKVFGLSAIIGRISYVYQNEMGNRPPPCSDPAAREQYRDDYTDFIRGFLAEVNVGKPADQIVYYDPPTGVDETGCVEFFGQIYTLDLNNPNDPSTMLDI